MAHTLSCFIVTKMTGEINKMNLKKCDRCGKKNSKNKIVFRFACVVSWPWYRYQGQDLCEECLEVFDTRFKRFMKDGRKK